MSIRSNSDGTYDVVNASGGVIASGLSLSTAQEIDNRSPSELNNIAATATSGCVGWLFSWFSQPLIKKYPYLLSRLIFIMWPGAIALYFYNAQSKQPANTYLILTAMILMFIFPSPLIKKIIRIIVYAAIAIAILSVIFFIIAFNAHWISAVPITPTVQPTPHK